MLKKIFLILGLVVSAPTFVTAASASSDQEELQRAPQCLIEDGQKCDFNIVDAAAKGHIPCCAMLLENPDTDVKSVGNAGQTALHHAARTGCLPLIHVLIERGAEINTQDDDGKTPLAHLLEAYDNLPAASEDAQDRTEAFANMVTLLIEQGAEIPQDKNTHALVQAAQKDIALRTQCAAQAPCGNNIYAACFLGHVSCVQRLITCGVDLSDEGALPNRAMDLVTTPLHWAAIGGHYEVIKLLLQADENLDINEKDTTGTTPLSYVSEWQIPSTKKLPMASPAQRKACIQQLILNHGARIPMATLPDDNSQVDYNVLIPGSLTEQVCLDLAKKPVDDPLFTGMSEEEIAQLQAGFKEVESDLEWRSMLAYSRHAANAGIVVGAGALVTDAIRHYAHAQRALKVVNRKNKIRMTPWQLRLRSCLNAWKQFKAKPLKDKKLFLFGLTSLTTGALMRWALAAQTPAAPQTSEKQS